VKETIQSGAIPAVTSLLEHPQLSANEKALMLLGRLLFSQGTKIIFELYISLCFFLMDSRIWKLQFALF
jgi:hypothetical protein